MKSLTRTLAILMLLIGGVVGISAQDDTEYCGDLSEADCALLSNSEPELPASTGFEGSVAVEVTGTEEFTFGVEMVGAYATDPTSRTDALSTLEETTLLELNAGDWLDYLDGIIGGADAELFIDIIPPEGSVPPMFATIPVELWLVDGVGYVDLSPLEMFAPEFDGIYGMSVVEASRYALGEVTVGDVIDGLESLGDSTGGDFDMDFSDGSASFNNQVQLTPEEGEAFLDEFVTITRLEDDEIDSEPVAVFEFDIDIIGLIESDVFAEGFEQNAPPGADMTAEEFASALTAAFVEEPSFTLKTYVGLESNYSYGFDYVFDIVVDPAEFAAAIGEEMESETVGVRVTTSFIRGDINEIDGISLPDGAVEVTVEELIEALAGPETEGI